MRFTGAISDRQPRIAAGDTLGRKHEGRYCGFSIPYFTRRFAGGAGEFYAFGANTTADVLESGDALRHFPAVLSLKNGDDIRTIQNLVGY